MLKKQSVRHLSGPKRTIGQKIMRSIRQEYMFHFMVLPAVAVIFIFHYIPIYGITVAFKDFSYNLGIMRSPWIGFDHFERFFSSFFFGRLIRNTLLLSFYSLIFGFPIPITFALLLNELQHKKLKKSIQTISYFPHFVSVVIVVGMLYTFLSPAHGIVNNIIRRFGGQPMEFLRNARWFRFLYVTSGIWQGFGWSSIVYLAAIAGISEELYEAAIVDGANRLQRVFYITLPGILPTTIILFILALGGLMNVGFEKIVLMYSPSIYDVSDVISTYVYRTSLLGGEFSFGAAVGFFNNVINFCLVVIANYISRRVTEVSLW